MLTVDGAGPRFGGGLEAVARRWQHVCERKDDDCLLVAASLYADV